MAIFSRCRLCWRITIVVFISIFVIEAAILVPSYLNYERDLLARLDEVGRSTVVSGFALEAARGAEDPIAIASALTRSSKLRGGAIYGADGALLGVFGEPPEPTPERLNAAAVPRDRGRNGERYEALWPAATTGLAVSIIGRLDASHIPDELVAFLWRIAGLVLLISGFVCAATMSILVRSVLAPLMVIRNALAAALENPAQADRQVLPEPRNDELGDTITTLAELFRRLSRTHREELATMLAVVDRTSDAIVAYDMAGRIVYANQACLALCGSDDIAEMERLGLPLIQREGGSAPVGLTQILAMGAFSGEADVIAKCGRVIPCMMNGARLEDPAGNPYRYFASITNVSELHDANEALERRNQELAETDRAKSEFLANMSHELRTPLNAIIGFSEIMAGEFLGELGNQKYHEYAVDIHESGEHLLHVINDILDLSKIEAGKIDLDEEIIDPSATIESSIRLVKEMADEHGIAVTARAEGAPPRLRADARKLRQVLINLLANAVKFTPDGGRIVVTTATPENGELAISVTDTGIGIAAEDIERVFAPFVQLDGGLDRRYEGTGLGLPLARAMVELHDGTLELESEPGTGTTVTIRFPSDRLVA